MYVTLSLEEIAVGLVLIALFIALVYTVILLKNLIKTIKYSNDILKNITTISDIAEKRTVELNDMADDVISATGEIARNIKGETGKLKQITALLGNISSLIGVIKNRRRTQPMALSGFMTARTASQTRPPRKPIGSSTPRIFAQRCRAPASPSPGSRVLATVRVAQRLKDLSKEFSRFSRSASKVGASA